MAEKETVRVRLDFPLEHVREPVIYHLVTDYSLIPDIRRANIDVRAGGMMVLQIEGTRANLDAGMQFLESLGITVTEVGTEEPWTV